MDTKIKTLKDLEKIKSDHIKDSGLDGKDKKYKVTVHMGTCGIASGADKIKEQAEENIKKSNLKNIIFTTSGCIGFCSGEPMLTVEEAGGEAYTYCNLDKEKVDLIFEEHLVGGEVADSLEPINENSNLPDFYKYQKRIILGNNSKIDPKSIGDYIKIGGYGALASVLKDKSPDEVIGEVKKSGLRGRGGGGFPTGLKWEFTRKAKGQPKYVIVNADEGDPGAYMDRGILEGNPHSVLEGLIIGAYAIGASQGYIYVRQEYPLAVEHIKEAIRQAREYGFLGEDILGSGFSFDVKVHRGAGAFVSGESSALISAIEGKVGEPKLKYIHTSESGLWGKPTNLNNVETWANIPLIMGKGWEWFKNIGTAGSSGTKIFSLVGKVKNTGLVEVPMGTTLKDIIFKIGGGMQDDRRFKGVQTGGPSGGVIPEELIGLPVDFDELDKAGSMMGSGGMIVMDESSCMVNVAHYFIKFLTDESCGKCVPCREGLRQALNIYERIISGEGKEEDLKLLSDLAVLLREGAMCALGSTAPNIILTTLKYFREEYESHIYYNMCPALVCKPLIRYEIDERRCSGCGICAESCPADAIVGETKKPHRIDQDLCTTCGTCIEVCPEKFSAISKKTGAKQEAAKKEKVNK
ncbi:MAG: NADH-ubiquinone oxidoreductase-F iron-sulfur binding region domain-containing protein [Candidatus Humimicrobiaceae bacterium]